MTKGKKASQGEAPAGADEKPAEAPAPEPAAAPAEAAASGSGVTEAAAKPAAEASPATLEEALAQLAEARAQAADYLDGWQRSRAEFANYKKRIEREQEQARNLVAGDVLTRYLPVVDDIERALKELPDDEGLRAWADGLELVHRKLLAVLEAEGVVTLQVVGQPFDPTVHEAISFEESDGVEHGVVIGVTRQGYRMGERVLRPAMVRVAR